MKKLAVCVLLVIVMFVLAGCPGGSTGAGNAPAPAEAREYYTHEQLVTFVRGNGHDPAMMDMGCDVVVINGVGQPGYYTSCNVLLRDVSPPEAWKVIISNGVLTIISGRLM